MEKLRGQLDDIVTEIALHIPPSDPARLACLALACKRLLWLLTRAHFRERYDSRHGGPPFVGYFFSGPTQDQNLDRFVPTAPPYKILSPSIDNAADSSDCWYVLDVRQSRVLLFLKSPGLIVWLPATGEHYLLPDPGRWYQYQAGAVICAESAHCKDPNCATLHDFCVVFVGCEDKLVTFDGVQIFDGNHTWGSTYSLKTNAWTEISELDDDRYRDQPLVEPNPPVLLGDALYFTLETHELEGEEVRAALKFDMTGQNLSVVTAPEDAKLNLGLFLSTSEGLAFAGFAEGDDEDAEDEGENGQNNVLSVWVLPSDNVPAEWNRVNDIDLTAILPPNAFPPARSPSVIGFFSGESKIFIEAGDRIFTVNIETLQTEDVGPCSEGEYILPFKHLYLPESPEEGRSNAAISFEEQQGSEEEDEEVLRRNMNKKQKPTQGVEQYGMSAKSDEAQSSEVNSQDSSTHTMDVVAEEKAPSQAIKRKREENDAARISVSDGTSASSPYVTNQSYITQDQSSQNLYQQVQSYNMQSSTYSDGYQQPSNAAFAYNNAYQPPQPAQMFIPSSAPVSSQPQQPQGSAPVPLPPQSVKAFTPANPVGLKNAEQYHQPNTLGSQLYTAAANQECPTASSAPYQTGPPATFNQPRSPVQYQTAPPVPSLGPTASVPGTVPNQMFPHSAATNSSARFVPSTNQGFVQRPGLSSAQPSSPTQAQEAAPPTPPLTVQTADTSKVSEVEDPPTGY